MIPEYQGGHIGLHYDIIIMVYVEYHMSVQLQIKY